VLSAQFPVPAGWHAFLGANPALVQRGATEAGGTRPLFCRRRVLAAGRPGIGRRGRPVTRTPLARMRRGVVAAEYDERDNCDCVPSFPELLWLDGEACYSTVAGLPAADGECGANL
jgi:hypothetical protein